ncbi:hypothetical protein ACFQ07_12275, partial [Actinomadura adrarensis]
MYQQPGYGHGPPRPQDTRPPTVNTAALLLGAIALLLLIDLVVDVLSYIDYADRIDGLGSGGPSTSLTISYVLGFLFTGALLAVFAALAALVRGGRYLARVLGLV